MIGKQSFAIAVVLTLAIVALASAHEGHKAVSTKGVRIDEKGILHLEAAAQKAIGLSHGQVDFGTVEQTVPLNCQVVLSWNRKAFASTRLEGVVESVLVRPGQKVNAGEALAVIQSLPLAALRLQYQQAQIELSFAEKNLRRASDLGESIIAGKELLSLEAARDDRSNTVATVRKKLEDLGAEGDKAFAITAPIDGTVVHVDVVVGRHVEPTEHLFEIGDLSVVWLECEVPENVVGQIGIGQEVRFQPFAHPGRTFSGKIDLMAFFMTPGESVRKVSAEIANPEELLLPGMFGLAEVVTHRAEDVFVAPLDAIVTDGAERYALVQEGPGAYRKANVVLGSSDSRSVEVLEGLYPGDVVVTAGNHQLSSLYVQGNLKISDEAKTNIGFALGEVDLQSVAQVLHVNGRIVSPPNSRGLATTRIAGKLKTIHATLGAQVAAGDPLATVESLDLQNTQLELIQLHLKQALVEKQLNFVNPLAEKGITSRKELLRLETQELEFESRFETLRRSLLVMGLSEQELAHVLSTHTTLPGVTVSAPIDGRVADIRVVVGQVIHKGEPLFDVVDPRTVWVEAAFFESDLQGLFEGSPRKPVVFRTVSYGAREWEARISFLNRELRGQDKVLQGWVEVQNQDGVLLPGMHASLFVTLREAKENVIAVPLCALLPVGNRRYVFVEQGNEFKRIEVELGKSDAHFAEVVHGVFPGDQVVVSGVNEMNNAFSAVR